MFILLLCILCFLSLGYLWKRCGRLAPNDPPMFSGALPIIGHAFMLYGDAAHVWDLLRKISLESTRVGGVIKLFLGPCNFYVITDPVDAMTAVNNTLEKSYIYDFAKPWVGDGLITAPPQTWKKHRKLLNPMFTQRALSGFISVFNYKARRLVNNLEAKLDQGPFEYERYLLVWSLETVCRTVLGFDAEEEGDENKKYVQAIDDLKEILVRRFSNIWYHSAFTYSLSSMKRRQDQVLDIIHKRLNKVLLKRKQIVKEKSLETAVNASEEFTPFIDYICMAAATENLTDAEVMDEVKTFIASAYDTTAHALINILLVLGAYPDIQDRVYKELEGIFANSDREVERDDLSRMVYMEAVIKETLRVYPVIPATAKRNSTEIKLSKYTLQANSNLVISIYGICRHPMWGEDADQFKPERWLDRACLPENPNAYPVFALGKRSCIGKTYALMSTKISLAHILRRYKLTSNLDNLTFKLEIVLKSVTPLCISLENRK